MTDKIVNFYNYVSNKHKLKFPDGYKNHHIKPNSRIGLIGASGTGKSNCLLNFLSRSSGDFYEVIICSFSTIDEPLYKMIKEKNPNITFIDDPEEIPDLDDYDDDKKHKHKLIVFDDFIALNKKQKIGRAHV